MIAGTGHLPHWNTNEKELSMQDAPTMSPRVGWVVPAADDGQVEAQEAEFSFTRAIITSLGDGVYALDAAGHVTFMNPAAEQMLGWTEAELLGHSMYETIHVQRAAGGRVPAEASPLLGLNSSDVTLRSDEDMFTRKDGTSFPVDFTSSPLAFHGHVVGEVVAFHDVTERKRAERALREQHAFVRLLQVVAVAANESWTADEPLQSCLDQVCAQTGWPVGHVYLHDATTGALLPTTLWHLDDPERFATFRAAIEMTILARGVGLPGQVLATGKPAWIADVSGAPDTERVREVMDLGIRAGFAFPVLVGTEVVAVLEFFAAEAAELDEPLAEVMATVGKQIGRVGERSRAQHQLQAVAAQLERSNRELQDFAAVASHDLQEPLRKIQAFGDRLQEKYSATLGVDGRDYLERMQSAAGRMQRLINDLLTFSRVTTRAQPFVPVDLGRVAQEVMADLEARVEQSNGRVEIGALPIIDAEPVQMRQLLQNLIGNGLKFHRPGEAPVVRVHAVVRTEDGGQSRQLCELVVRDNGIGFDDKYLDRIFAIFQRLHQRGTYEGTGVGLAICRKIVERHGGTITAQGGAGKGASFVVTLPVRQPKQDMEMLQL